MFTNNQKIIVGISIFSLLAFVWMFRWHIEFNNEFQAVRLDRWTGDLLLCAGFVSCRNLELEE